jgi:hypothetical protein
MRDAQNHYNATTSVHGITDTSTLTTASNTQTFTNKTLTSPTINGATLTGAVANSSTITGGTISGSTLSGTTTNSGTISGGNVAATFTGNLTGNVTGNVTGNAATATALQTARTINNISFNGTANITVPAAAGTLTGTALPSTVTTATGLTIAESQVTNLTSDLALKAPLASPTFTGTVTIPTGATVTSPNISGATLSGTTTATSGTIAFGTNANAITAYGVTITAAELSTLDFIDTSQPIQTQLNNKADSTIGTWATWTGLTVSGGISAIGNGTLTARYTSINKTTHFELQFTVGSTTTFTGSTTITFNLPTGAESTESPNWMAGNLLVGSTYYALNCRLTGTSLVPFGLTSSASTAWSALTSTNLATLATGSVVTINGTYEAA